MQYFLMRKDDIITLCDFDEEGRMLSFAPGIKNMEMAPLSFRYYNDWLKRWWEDRRIPMNQGRIVSILRAKGFIGTGEYLLKNLGLSLTDYYWICPVSLKLKWKDVNLFDNDFKEDLVSGKIPDRGSAPLSYTPNSSLKGKLEKTWVIRNQKRCLVKGNHRDLSSESINEVIASELHRAQGYDNHTKYSLIKIKNRPYDYGCISEAFTNGSVELISAYALLTSEPKGDKSSFEHLIDVASKHGADRELLRAGLEYQIMTDYILSNVDRHMENIGFLRDADTLKIISMAPIFDSGRSLFANSVAASTDEEFDSIEINSFEQTESALLRLVTDKGLVDPSKILPPERIETLYRKDSKISEYRVGAVRRAYEKKLAMFEKWQKR